MKSTTYNANYWLNDWKSLPFSLSNEIQRERRKKNNLKTGTYTYMHRGIILTVEINSSAVDSFITYVFNGVDSLLFKLWKHIILRSNTYYSQQIDWINCYSFETLIAVNATGRWLFHQLRDWRRNRMKSGIYRCLDRSRNRLASLLFLCIYNVFIKLFVINDDFTRVWCMIVVILYVRTLFWINWNRRIQFESALVHSHIKETHGRQKQKQNGRAPQM